MNPANRESFTTLNSSLRTNNTSNRDRIGSDNSTFSLKFKRSS